MSDSDQHAAPDPDGQAALARGRECYAQRAWADAYAALSLADRRSQLADQDLECLSLSALLIGRDEDGFVYLERLHQRYLDGGAIAAAVRCAFWSGFRLFAMGEMARAGAWLGRADRLVESSATDCVERGYLLLPVAYRHAGAADHQAAYAIAGAALAIGERHRDRDLIALARNIQGRALVKQGEIEAGLALMDESMLAASSGELSPVVTGLVYCSLIAGCHQVFALGRAREWTQALARWWQTQPQLVAFTGACKVHRVELLQLDGAWPEAIDEARRATSELHCANERSAAADAYYQAGEIHRLRGEDAQAEEAYRSANQLGREPQPGLALLRLAQARPDLALQSIRRILGATKERLQRARYLPAFIEIMLATGALEDARSGSRELREIAALCNSEFLTAMVDHAEGAICLAEGDAQAALAPLRRALSVWQRVAAPYIVARLRVLVSRACSALGDEDGASLELDAARRVFEQLGAAPDLASLSPPGKPATAASHNLSPRELQVLLLVAAGKTNKQIARELGVSEKTIDRHVSNIFSKLDVPSRAAATAFAYERGLI
jgi:DNA-binding CsgD family transcriptional regulator